LTETAVTAYIALIVIVFRRRVHAMLHEPITAPAAPPPPATRDAGPDAYLMLRIAFTVAPIAFGLDKFFNVLVDWPVYLASWVDDPMPGSAQDFMYAVGVVEIAAGVLVALRPRLGAPIVAAWLAGIVLNLLTGPGDYDVALRDFGLMLGALTLARLALHYDRAGS
jgi:hypothetical protein